MTHVPFLKPHMASTENLHATSSEIGSLLPKGKECRIISYIGATRGNALIVFLGLSQTGTHRTFFSESHLIHFSSEG